MLYYTAAGDSYIMPQLSVPETLSIKVDPNLSCDLLWKTGKDGGEIVHSDFGILCATRGHPSGYAADIVVREIKAFVNGKLAKHHSKNDTYRCLIMTEKAQASFVLGAALARSQTPHLIVLGFLCF